jgi:hypothetical protein
MSEAVGLADLGVVARLDIDAATVTYEPDCHAAALEEREDGEGPRAFRRAEKGSSYFELALNPAVRSIMSDLPNGVTLGETGATCDKAITCGTGPLVF